MKNRHGMTSLLAWLLVVAMCICAVPIHGAGTQNVALPFQKAENAAADGALPERIPEEIPDSPPSRRSPRRTCRRAPSPSRGRR